MQTAVGELFIQLSLAPISDHVKHECSIHAALIPRLLPILMRRDDDRASCVLALALVLPMRFVLRSHRCLFAVRLSAFTFTLCFGPVHDQIHADRCVASASQYVRCSGSLLHHRMAALRSRVRVERTIYSSHLHQAHLLEKDKCFRLNGTRQNSFGPNSKANVWLNGCPIWNAHFVRGKRAGHRESLKDFSCAGVS